MDNIIIMEIKHSLKNLLHNLACLLISYFFLALYILINVPALTNSITRNKYLTSFD